MDALPPVELVIERLRNIGVRLPDGRVRIGGFGDSAALSKALLGLIIDGHKRAGASLLWAHEAEKKAYPEVGEIEIIVNHGDQPVLVTRITKVDVIPYVEVSAEFAALEGEGDGSLEYWRRVHWPYFSRECERINRVPTETMPVVCSVFEVLHVLPNSPAA